MLTHSRDSKPTNPFWAHSRLRFVAMEASNCSVLASPCVSALVWVFSALKTLSHVHLQQTESVNLCSVNRSNFRPRKLADLSLLSVFSLVNTLSAENSQTHPLFFQWKKHVLSPFNEKYLLLWSFEGLLSTNCNSWFLRDLGYLLMNWLRNTLSRYFWRFGLPFDYRYLK